MTMEANHPMVDSSYGSLLDSRLSSVARSLDLSFREIDGPESLKDVYRELIEQATESAMENQPLPRATFEIVKLNNNYISDLSGLVEALDEICEVNKIQVLDLSFNHIRQIDDHLAGLTDLRSLYFHANEVSRFTQVENLAKLPKLANVTLHANPVREKANYRKVLLSTLTGLRRLDFSSITPQERKDSIYWRQMTNVKVIGSGTEGSPNSKGNSP
eukprot:gb/GECG01007342.1/.p1 GENE.gb/GECG01007342.1/~~gb/GECG01007342.1/.p1  ORF type:complete len:216 (+),score=14.70 gb/GECG01007342.1/:1-648(+)